MNIIELNKEINCTGYAVNNSKSYMRSVAESLTRIEFASSLVEQKILKEELYKNFVSIQKIEIKDAFASVYAYLHLEDVKGHIDHAFTSKQDAEIDRLRKALEEIYDQASITQDESESPSTRYNAANMIKHKVNQALEPAKGEDERE